MRGLSTNIILQFNDSFRKQKIIRPEYIKQAYQT